MSTTKKILLLEVTPKVIPAGRVEISQVGGSRRDGEEVGIPGLVPCVLFL